MIGNRRYLLGGLLAAGFGIRFLSENGDGSAQAVRTRYVDAESGNDDETVAGTEDDPFETISRAVEDAEPGDHIVIAAGEYEERVRIDRSGTSVNPIVVAAAPDADVVIRKGGFQISADYIELGDLTIDDNDDDDEAGVFIYGGTGIALRNLTVTNNDGGGLRVKPTDAPVIDLLVDGGHYGQNNRAGISAVGGDALVNLQIRNVTVEDNAADGIQVERASQVTVEGASVARNGLDDARNGVFLKSVRGAVVQGVFTSGNGHNGIALRMSDDILVARCVSVGNGHHGFDSIEGCARIAYVNNVSTRNGESTEDKGIYVTDTDEIRIVNNIFADNAGDQMAFSTEGGPISNVMSDFNLVWNTDGDRLIRYDTSYYTNVLQFQTETGLDMHSLHAEPGFVDGEALDFRLADDSPAIDAGTEFEGVTTDYEGSAPDCGAFEHAR